MLLSGVCVYVSVVEVGFVCMSLLSRVCVYISVVEVGFVCMSVLLRWGLCVCHC